MNDVSNRTAVQEPAMYQNMSAEVGRTRQHDLLAAAAHQRLVAEAKGEQPGITVRLRSTIARFRGSRRTQPVATPAVRPAINPAS